MPRRDSPTRSMMSRTRTLWASLALRASVGHQKCDAVGIRTAVCRDVEDQVLGLGVDDDLRAGGIHGYGRVGVEPRAVAVMALTGPGRELRALLAPAAFSGRASESPDVVPTSTSCG